ncbi:anaerobic ribonucleoside-triphosphate reductase [candidate division TA06 bacterium]|nr:anaerobic ribonucleoside-triphosphate reductase [candidate division TA06 bacterium]
MNPPDAEMIAKGQSSQDSSEVPRFLMVENAKDKQINADPLMPFNVVQKRSGEIVNFDRRKIAEAIFKAAQAVGGADHLLADALAEQVELLLHSAKGGQHLPNVEEIQDAVEKILIERGHAKTAKAFILYRDQRSKVRRQNFNIRQVQMGEVVRDNDATDLALFIQTSEDNVAQWDREKIVKALKKEAGVAEDIAQKIAAEVEQQILDAKVKRLTSSLVRELVDAKLIEYGLEEARKRHSRLGMPLYDVEKVLTDRNRENANIPHNPEATNMTLAETINKQFALARVFSTDVADAHSRGDIHLHDLGFINRPYCSGQSLEYVKKFGLSLPNALSIAKPAKHPDTLLAHMVKMSAALQGHFAGAIGWDAVNVFFAPFLVGMSDREISQLAQMMIFEYSQQSVARGGQAIFSDLNIYWETPKHFENVPAIGPGGEYTGKKYGDYLKESQRFAWALFEVYKGGDGTGRPFFFPKPQAHITEKFFLTPGHQEYLELICSVAADKGNTYFVFDRGETAKISECCRLAFKLDDRDLMDANTPWKMRYSALQNITVNLPRIAYLAKGDTNQLYKKIDEFLHLTVKGHQQKRKFIEKLMNLKDQGPLALLAMEKDGEPYLRMGRVTFLIGMLGLNEMVQHHMGQEMHESEEAYKFGLKMIAYMHLKIKELAKEYGMKFVLEQTPAESTAFRFAKLDMQQFTKDAEKVVKGSVKDGTVYYTNSTYLNVAYQMNPIDRVKQEGKFHDMIEAGALTHIWLADSHPTPSSIANFVVKSFRQTRNAQIAFSPEFTTCNSCGKVYRGLKDECPNCSRKAVEGIKKIK